jgi:hypothetical protein
MSLDRDDIIRQVEFLLKAHPNATLPIIAQMMGIAEQLITDALREAEGLSFQEYRAARLLDQAFSQLGEFSIAASGPAERRAQRRAIIPKATVKYRIHGFWNRSESFSDPCPLVDFGCDGLALLTDESVEPQKQLSLIIKFPGEEETVQVEGCVVYAVATGIAGFRYRLGIQFLPFGKHKGGNTLKALDTLTRIEKIYTP